MTSSDDYLDQIRQHLEDIQSKKLLDLVQQLENDRTLLTQREELADAEDQYNQLRQLFDQFKVKLKNLRIIQN